MPTVTSARAHKPLDLRSTYEFHSALESPADFLRRERKTVFLCMAAFSVLLLAAIAFIDPAFFYPRLQTDPLNYYLKAQALLETGSTDARWAINSRPFAYVSLPGIIRAPFLLAFREFDDQLRGMQVANIPIVASVALMSAYIVSWALPPARHSAAIVFAFIFTLLSPVWMYNVFMPMVDAPLAACTLAFIIASVRLLCSPRPIRTRPLLVLFATAAFTGAFLFRFTAPVLLLFLIPLAIARWNRYGLSTGLRWTGAALLVAAMGALAVLNRATILGRYFGEPFQFLNKGDKPGMVVNLFGAAFPTQIVPTFHLGFLHAPVVGIYRTAFFTEPRIAAWAGVGILISIVILTGMWRSRERYLPEILLLAGALPVITLMMPSTTRYLMVYQPLFWIFFYVGAAFLAKRHAPWLVRLLRSRRAMAATLAAAVLLAVGLRSVKASGSTLSPSLAVRADNVPAHVDEVSGVFRELREYLETLPRDRALLIGTRGAMGRWKAISSLDYYNPDSALARVATEREVYVVLECSNAAACGAWESSKELVIERISRTGSYLFEPVFASARPRARAEVLRLTPR